MTYYPAYTQLRVSVSFTDSSGTLTDPTTITVAIANAAASSLTIYTYGVDIQVVKQSTGIYYMDYTPPNTGTFTFQWKGTGTVVAADEGEFEVEATDF